MHKVSSGSIAKSSGTKHTPAASAHHPTINGVPFPHFRNGLLRYARTGATATQQVGAEENLLLRGDNLSVLKSLQPAFTGAVKLIYIDPPYNTASDVFHYADNLERDAWLQMIRLRVEAALPLLADDGLLFFHISFHQHAWAHLLLDELFRGHHLATFHLLVRHPDRILKGDKEIHDVMEHLLVFGKGKNARLARRIEPAGLDAYVYEISETAPGELLAIDGQEIRVFPPGSYRITRGAPASGKLQKISIRGSLKEGNSSGRFYMKHIAPLSATFPPETLLRVPAIGNDGLGHRYFYTPAKVRRNGGYYQGVPMDHKGYREKPYPNFLDLVQAFNNVGYEGGVQFRNGKKPEALIRQVFAMGGVQKGDRVLDFFLGSGTTAAVAHKMGVRYIGVEQTDYGEHDALVRLQQVVAGTDSKGITGEIGWEGGGSFVFGAMADPAKD